MCFIKDNLIYRDVIQNLKVSQMKIFTFCYTRISVLVHENIQHRHSWFIKSELALYSQINQKTTYKVIRKLWSRDKLVKLVKLETNISWTPKFKPGETSTIITNSLSNKVTKSGQDPESLGKWSFITLEGKTKTT